MNESSCSSLYRTIWQLNDFKNHAMAEGAKEAGHKKPEMDPEIAKREQRAMKPKQAQDILKFIDDFTGMFQGLAGQAAELVDAVSGVTDTGSDRKRRFAADLMKQMYEKAVADDNLGSRMDNHDYNKPKFE